jgi:hypothetical protein
MALMRATLLYFIQNIDFEKLPDAYSLLAEWFNDETDGWDWVRPSTSREKLRLVAAIETRVASPTFFDD